MVERDLRPDGLSPAHRRVLSDRRRVPRGDTGRVHGGNVVERLVLGVTAQTITTLHTMPPQADAAPSAGAPVPPFAQLLAKLRRDPQGPSGEH